MRLQEVAEHSTLNAIDYLEVLDTSLPIPLRHLRQRLLIVHCLRQVSTITIENIRIEGGVRRPVHVSKVNVALEMADSLVSLPAGERKGFLDNDDPNRVLIVETDSPGDFSNYKLKVVQSVGSHNPPPEFDPILSEIEFSFKVECPSDFDCKPKQVVAVSKYPEPPIDYLAKDYASFRRLLLDRMSTVIPDWAERNAADEGVALVEALAYTGDLLSYYQDAVANEAYLGTARKRISVRRHAKLVDYTLHEGCDSRVWVQLQSGAGDVYVEKGKQLMTRLPGFNVRIVPDSSEYDKAVSMEPQIFETMHDMVISDANNEIGFYTWSDEECCLPIGATKATLLDDPSNRVKLRCGDVLVFEEIRSGDSGFRADKNPNHRHAVRLTEVYPEAELVKQADGTFKRELKEEGGTVQAAKDPLNGMLIVEIAWSEADAIPFSLCLKRVVDPLDGSGEKLPVSVAHGNIVLADHGRTLGSGKNGVDDLPEKLPDVEGGNYRPLLKWTGITHSVAYDNDAAINIPASETLGQEPRDAIASVTLQDGEGNEWTPVLDLLESHEFDRAFVVEMEDDGTAQLRFGDDALGAAPNEGTKFTAVYRIGNGRAGNVGADSIAHIVTSDDGISAVRNPLAAASGVDAESFEEARLYAPQAFRTQKRAVTAEDYAAVAMLHPDVQKAVATLRWTGSWHAMFITVDLKNGREVDAGFESELVEFINGFRLAGHDLEIEPPIFVPLEIVMTVCVCKNCFRDVVQQALMERFSNRDLPEGTRGFFHPDNFTFGQPVYLSQLVEKAMEIPGVNWVSLDGDPNRFKRWGEAPHNEIDDGLITMGRLEIARLDNDPNSPENGKIKFIIEGGL